MMEENKLLFGTYLRKLREAQNASLAQLCEGLCTHQELSRIEKGSWEPHCLLKEALLERLGIGAEDYEYLLPFEEAAHLKHRAGILESILWGRREEASARLEQYRRDYGEENGTDRKPAPNGAEKERRPAAGKLSLQFYLHMKGQMEKDRLPQKERYAIFLQALELTVPAFEKKPLKELCLSSAELDLALEIEQCREGGPKRTKLLELITYIEEKSLDGRGMAKIYPKAVSILFGCPEEPGEEASGGTPNDAPTSNNTFQENQDPRLDKMGWERLLWEHCERSLGILLGNGRMYWLWEILDMREKLLEQKLERYTRQENWMSADTQAELEKTRRWKDTLEQLYGSFHISARTQDACYLYMPKGFYFVNEVVLTRRRMLGMSREQLCQGICSLKTLRRLEENTTTPRREIVRELLNRLGMSGEYVRMDVETDSQEARELLQELRDKMNKCYWEDSELLLKRLQDMFNTKSPWNRQVVLNAAATIGWKKKEIDDKRYCQLQQEALEQTMPFSCFLQKGDKFLTNKEQTCIQNMMQGMDRDSELFLSCLERFEEYYMPFIEKGMADTVGSMYALVMGMVKSEYGNRGEYEKSDFYNVPILQGNLRLRKLRGLAHALYARWWNYEERRKKGIPDDRSLDGVTELTRCLVLSDMAGDRNKVLFCQRKLEKLKTALMVSRYEP